MSTCPDCLRCATCDRIAYCLTEPPPPCPHDSGCCEDCRLDECGECIDEIEREAMA